MPAEVRAREDRLGFSLVEVMCAILILGIGLAGMTHGITTALSSSKESELQTTAALLAAGRIEALRAEGFLVEGVLDGTYSGSLSLYRWKETVASTSIDGLYEITVTIDQTETGRPIYQLQTLLFDPPLSSSTVEEAQPSSPRERARRERRRR
jgi:type IV pilus modification protein PilV